MRSKDHKQLFEGKKRYVKTRKALESLQLWRPVASEKMVKMYCNDKKGNKKYKTEPVSSKDHEQQKGRWMKSLHGFKNGNLSTGGLLDMIIRNDSQ